MRVELHRQGWLGLALRLMWLHDERNAETLLHRRGFGRTIQDIIDLVTRVEGFADKPRKSHGRPITKVLVTASCQSTATSTEHSNMEGRQLHGRAALEMMLNASLSKDTSTARSYWPAEH